MMKPRPLEELYAKLTPVVNSEPTTAHPSVIPQQGGHFNVFQVADLMRGYPNKPPMTFDRRAFYKICLLHGRSRVEYADQTVDIDQMALWFATSRVPYRWLPHDPAQEGYYCIFTDEFLLPTNSGAILSQLPIFQSNACPVLPLTKAEYEATEVIFKKMAEEITSSYAFRHDLLRAYLLELIYVGQKLQPTPVLTHPQNASARLTALFTDLLERQFPLATPQQTLRLRTATDYADQLAVHVNHLNRILKDTTGHTTTTLIGNRVAQEAKLLLKQTSWSVSEIADCLGFADIAHFCHFFKRQTGLVPGTFRE